MISKPVILFLGIYLRERSQNANGCGLSCKGLCAGGDGGGNLPT
jgi:hypothetical protein